MTQEIEYTIKQLESMLDAASSVGCFEDYNALNTSLTLCRAELARQGAKPLTIYGYPIELLQKVAVLLRDERMTISDLKKCVDNFTYCAEMTLKMIRADTEASLAQSIADMQNFYSPYTEGENP